MAVYWDGNDWEEYCMLLLNKRYSMQLPHTFQRVPAQHKGDLGLEAYSHGGVAYQCYAVKEPSDTRTRYEKQRDKLTVDLGKLVEKQTQILSMVGSTVIEKYVFMVPLFNSRFLLDHARVKEKEIITHHLPFVSENFKIIIETAKNYGPEMALLHAIPKPFFSETTVDSNQSDDWSQQHRELGAVVNEKLKKIINSETDRGNIQSALMKQFLKGENALAQLRNSSPDGFVSVARTKSHKEDLLTLEYPSSGNTTQTIMTIIVKDLASEYLRSTPILDPETVETLAWAPH